MLTRLVLVVVFAILLIIIGSWLETVLRGGYVFWNNKTQVFFIGACLMVAVFFGLLLIIGE